MAQSRESEPEQGEDVHTGPEVVKEEILAQDWEPTRVAEYDVRV